MYAEYLGAARAILRNNGGTFLGDGRAVMHNRGYYVGGLVPSALVAYRPGVAWVATNLGRFAAQHKAVLARPDAYLGAWIDGETLYLDVSQHLFSRDNALTLGAARGELAVWDCQAGCAIPVQ